MNRILPLALALLALPVVVHAQGQSGLSVYVQPSVVGVALGSNLKDAAGGSIVVGVSFLGPHSIEADFTSFDTDAKGDSTDTYKFEQYLATYKYEFSKGGNLAFHLGGSVGVTEERHDFVIDYMLPFGAVAYHLSDNAFTYGVQGDVTYRFNRNIGVILGAKILGLSQSTITTGGSMTLLTLGLNFRF